MAVVLQETEEFQEFMAGTTAHLVRFIYKYDGKTKIDANDTPTITITDSEGTTRVDNDTCSNNTTGEYYYEYEIPGDAPEGVWLVEWHYNATKIATAKDYQETIAIFVYKEASYNAGE